MNLLSSEHLCKTNNFVIYEMNFSLRIDILKWTDNKQQFHTCSVVGRNLQKKLGSQETEFSNILLNA